MKRRERGFTLIELIAMMVVVSAGIIALLAVSVNAARRVGDNKDYITGAQLAQQKAEEILSDRRNGNRGYDYIVVQTNSCTSVSSTCTYPVETAVTGFTSFSRNVEVTTASNSLCDASTGPGCKKVVVTVNKGSAGMANVTFLLASY